MATGLATLGFSGGPSVRFRIDPNSIDWNWQIDTSVTPTIGGRVVQVIGATLTDLTVNGSFGQDHGSGPDGESWLLAEAFYKRIRAMMDHQSADATDSGKMQPPAVFTYPPKNWRFSCYIKDLIDPDGGGSITHSTGKFAHNYSLVLFIVEELSDSLIKAGTSHGVLNTAKAKAINDYLARISDGIGWHFSQYNGTVAGDGTKQADPKKGAGQGGETNPNQPTK
jgi:hypothetical protein